MDLSPLTPDIKNIILESLPPSVFIELCTKLLTKSYDGGNGKPILQRFVKSYDGRDLNRDLIQHTRNGDVLTWWAVHEILLRYLELGNSISCDILQVLVRLLVDRCTYFTNSIDYAKIDVFDKFFATLQNCEFLNILLDIPSCRIPKDTTKELYKLAFKHMHIGLFKKLLGNFNGKREFFANLNWIVGRSIHTSDAFFNAIMDRIDMNNIIYYSSFRIVKAIHKNLVHLRAKNLKRVIEKFQSVLYFEPYEKDFKDRLMKRR
jgi:hypothetical protein